MTYTLDLGGRVVAVTGAAGGIGSAVGRMFAAAGADVVGLDVLAAQGVLRCDVGDEAALAEALGGVAGLTDVVHAAGTVAVGSVADTAVAEVAAVLAANLLSSFVVARVASPLLPAGGTMTFLSSQAGLRGAPEWSAYGASKAGVLTLVQSLAGELGPRGVRVNAVCPGSVRSRMMDEVAGKVAGLRGTTAQAVLARYARASPLGRMAEPDDVAGACLFLASPLAAYVTGVALPVDGGEVPG